MSSPVNKIVCETFEVRFDGFEGLPSRKGDCTESPEFTCFGHQWALGIYPGGERRSGDGQSAAYIFHKSAGSIEVQATFAVKNAKGSAAAYYCMESKTFEPWTEENKGWGRHNFAKRSTIIEALEDGTLVIEVHMKQPGPSTLTAPFVPENPCSKNTLSKFLDEASADVVFEVSSEPTENRRKKKAKTSPTTFHAHRFVLPASGALAEACEASHDMSPIVISGTKPEIFHHLLHYLYGGAMDGSEMKENAKDIIDAADRFGIAGMKLAAEASYVASTSITIENAIDNLLYADAKNCAFLKEAVMDFIAKNLDEGIKRLSFDDVPGSMMKDLMTAVAREKKGPSARTEPNDLTTARVGTLRKMLHEKGLEVDGSREAMIARLEEHS